MTTKIRFVVLAGVLALALGGCKNQGSGGTKGPGPGAPPPPGAVPEPPPPPEGKAAPTNTAAAAKKQPKENTPGGDDRPEPPPQNRPEGAFGPAWVTDPKMPKSQYMGRSKLEPGKDKGQDTAETCAKSFDCKLNGHCSVHEGWCVVLQDKDCAGAVVCKEEGRCWAVGKKPWEVSCQAKTDEDCKKSNDCPNYGRCTVVEGRCQATTDEQCKKSRVCRAEKKCRAEKGECAR